MRPPDEAKPQRRHRQWQQRRLRPGRAGRPAHDRNNGWANGYPHGETPPLTAGPATAEYIYKNVARPPAMRVVRTTGKTFPTFHWSGGEWVAGWPKEVVPYRLPELLAARDGPARASMRR